MVGFTENQKFVMEIMCQYPKANKMFKDMYCKIQPMTLDLDTRNSESINQLYKHIFPHDKMRMYHFSRFKLERFFAPLFSEEIMTISPDPRLSKSRKDMMPRCEQGYVIKIKPFKEFMQPIIACNNFVLFHKTYDFVKYVTTQVLWLYNRMPGREDASYYHNDIFSRAGISRVEYNRVINHMILKYPDVYENFKGLFQVKLLPFISLYKEWEMEININDESIANSTDESSSKKEGKKPSKQNKESPEPTG